MDKFQTDLVRLDEMLHKMKEDDELNKVLQPNEFEYVGLCQLKQNPDMHEVEVLLHYMHVQPYEVFEIEEDTSLESEIGNLQCYNMPISVTGLVNTLSENVLNLDLHINEIPVHDLHTAEMLTFRSESELHPEQIFENIDVNVPNENDNVKLNSYE